ncbi:MAG: hypothetical protein KDI61_03890, partial [Alphaproteobacteria bacterium]|nr:hypothetical protein [Alphaproteobacteria bacterium]
PRLPMMAIMFALPVPCTKGVKRLLNPDVFCGFSGAKVGHEACDPGFLSQVYELFTLFACRLYANSNGLTLARIELSIFVFLYITSHEPEVLS